MKKSKAVASVEDIITQAKADIKQFGTDMVYDNRFNEIHEMCHDTDFLRPKPAAEAGAVLVQLLDHEDEDWQKDEVGKYLVMGLLMELDDMSDQWFSELLSCDERLPDLY